MERAVGWFVFLATALLLFGFGYYIYHTAERKGWFVIKAQFHIYVQSSPGLNVGDPVYMMGFPVGQITSDPSACRRATLTMSRWNLKSAIRISAISGRKAPLRK